MISFYSDALILNLLISSYNNSILFTGAVYRIGKIGATKDNKFYHASSETSLVYLELIMTLLCSQTLFIVEARVEPTKDSGSAVPALCATAVTLASCTSCSL